MENNDNTDHSSASAERKDPSSQPTSNDSHLGASASRDEFDMLMEEFEAAYFDLVAREMPREDLPQGQLSFEQLARIKEVIEEATSELRSIRPSEQ